MLTRLRMIWLLLLLIFSLALRWVGFILALPGLLMIDTGDWIDEKVRKGEERE